MTDVLIIGGGVAGLVAAYRLKQAGKQVVVVEKEDVVGGRARTITVDGLEAERAAQFLTQFYMRTNALLQELDIADQKSIIQAPNGIVMNDRVTALKPLPFLLGSLLPFMSKLRLLRLGWDVWWHRHLLDVEDVLKSEPLDTETVLTYAERVLDNSILNTENSGKNEGDKMDKMWDECKDEKLQEYIEPILAKFTHKGVIEKIKQTISQIVSKKTIRLWTVASDKREFERMRTLFNGQLQSVLDDQKISEALREMSVTGLSDEAVVIALHDPCDIRKEYSEKLENLGIVRDLKGKLVNGYNTFNTVCINGDGKRLHLSDITVYGNNILILVLAVLLKKQEIRHNEATHIPKRGFP